MSEKLNRTGIEWALNPDGSRGYSWNPLTGCRGVKGDGNLCPYCYANVLANTRLKGRCGYPEEGSFEPTFHTNRLDAPKSRRKPSGIFTVDMGDLWGDWVPEKDIRRILQVVRECRQHTFYMLTKNPARYLEFVDDWPSNAWAGATVDMDSVIERADDLRTFKMKRAQVSGISQIVFLSIEPMLTSMASLDLAMIDWIIIGGLSKSDYRPPGWSWGPNKVPPHKTWIRQVLTQADIWGSQVFLKNNLPWNEVPFRRDHPLIRRE